MRAAAPGLPPYLLERLLLEHFDLTPTQLAAMSVHRQRVLLAAAAELHDAEPGRRARVASAGVLERGCWRRGCGHPLDAHDHYRRGTDCSASGCRCMRARRWPAPRDLLWGARLLWAMWRAA